MEIILVVIAIVGLIIALAVSYKDKNNLQANFELKVKELDEKDNTINTQKDELANRKDQIESERKLKIKAVNDLELVKAALESKREDFETLKTQNETLKSKITTIKNETIEEIKLQNVDAINSANESIRRYEGIISDQSDSMKRQNERITTLEEELEKSQEDNKQLLTQLTPKKNGKRNPKN